MSTIRTDKTDYAEILPDEKQPGRYVSPLTKYPGYVQFPYPLMYPHFKEWWKLTIEPLKNVSKLDFGAVDFEWEGAKYLILEFGEWAIRGDHASQGDAKKNDVPVEVVNFVRRAADHYLYPQLSPKELRLLSTSG